jgi:hypothetical protein
MQEAMKSRIRATIEVVSVPWPVLLIRFGFSLDPDPVPDPDPGI